MSDFVQIYGASDDLVELRVMRDGHETEEEYPCETSAVIGFSNGLLFRLSYDNDGEWVFKSLHVHGESWQIEEVGEAHDYSEQLTVLHPLSWVMIGGEYMNV